jgi:hydrogenase/urease accessory protein HupE
MNASACGHYPYLLSVKRIVLLALFALLAVSAGAHDPGLGTAEVTLAPAEIKLQLGYAPADLAATLPGLRGGMWSQSEFEMNRSAIEAAAARFWAVTRGGQALASAQVHAWLQSSNSIRIDVSCPEKGAGTLKIEDIAIAAMPAGHRDYLSVTGMGGKVSIEQLVDAKTGAVLVPGADVTGRPATPFWAFLRLGVMHIWTGYDHLLFLFGLLVVCRSFRSIAAIISCFTLAHSLTLALSTLNIVTVPSRIIEPVIAASILYVGLENLIRRGAEPQARWVLTFMFGLIHGFGFATALKELGVGTDGRGVALPLFAFNLGVEFGQISIAAAVLPLVWQLRKRPGFVLRGVPALSLVVAAMGLAWLLQRTVPGWE